MSSDLDQKKLDLMWKRVLQYEQKESIGDKKNTSVQKIAKIIDEVYRQCY